MRVAAAWFLLFLSMSQWVGGFLCFEISYFVEARHQMSDAEEYIAANLTAENGIESSVRVLQEDEVLPRGNFYGDFVFSQKLKDSTVYFTLESGSKSVTYEAVSGQTSPEPDKEAGKTALLKSLFSEFMIPSPEWPTEKKAECQFIPCFHVADCHSLPFTTILSPPPDFVA